MSNKLHIVALKPVLVNGRLFPVGTVSVPGDVFHEALVKQYPPSNGFACHDPSNITAKHAVVFYDAESVEGGDAAMIAFAKSKEMVNKRNQPRYVKISRAYVKDTEVKKDKVVEDVKTTLSVNGVDNVKVDSKIVEEVVEAPKELTEKDFRRKRSKEAPSKE